VLANNGFYVDSFTKINTKINRSDFNLDLICHERSKILYYTILIKISTRTLSNFHYVTKSYLDISVRLTTT